ncbi:hypothetical protein J467_4363, partial [Acinetobacter baumannii 916567]
MSWCLVSGYRFYTLNDLDVKQSDAMESHLNDYADT